VLKHALNEYNSSKYDVEAAKCKNLLNKIADQWWGKSEEKGVRKNGPNKVPKCQFINNPTGT